MVIKDVSGMYGKGFLMGIVRLDGITIEFDNYKCIPEKNTILFYQSDNNIPCVTMDANILSDDGVELFYSACD